MHKIVVDNQKNQLNLLINTLEHNSCVVIMDFKENFRLSQPGNKISCAFYNKRQVSCLGISLIYKVNGQQIIEYVNYLSNILSHDSLFASETLENFIRELDCKYKYVNIFTDCGPHFRSKEFINNVRSISNKFNITATVNYFAEYHGKSIVDGNFGRISKIFKEIDRDNEISSIDELITLFNNKASENRAGKTFFRKYERHERKKYIKKIKIKNFKEYMSYGFNNGKCYKSFMTKINGCYEEFNYENQKIIDKRQTILTPTSNFVERISKYFSKRVEKLLLSRIG